MYFLFAGGVSMSVADMIEEFKSFSESYRDSRVRLIEEINLLERYLSDNKFKYIEHESHGTSNGFYYKSDVDVVFVTYYNRYSDLVAYTLMDKSLFDTMFASNIKKKIAFTERRDSQYKAIVSMNGTYVPLSHLVVNFNRDENECVDHMLSNIWINISKYLRVCSIAENNKNKRNRKNKSDSKFDYNSAMDFRENWWLIPLATMLHVITMEDAIECNRRCLDADEKL